MTDPPTAGAPPPPPQPHLEDLVPLARSGVPAGAQAAARGKAGPGAALWGEVGGGRVMAAPADMPAWSGGSGTAAAGGRAAVAVVELGLQIKLDD